MLRVACAALVALHAGAFAPAPRRALARLRPAPALPDPGAAVDLKYAFMLPTAAGVATCCQLCGIGGAALFSPVFLLVFPLLGPEYPLDGAAAAVASALLTEAFGFASGLVGYARRGLVAWPVARDYAAVTVPVALAGALAAPALAGDARALRAVYAALMLSLSAFLARGARPGDCAVDGAAVEVATTDGVLTYAPPARTPATTAATAGGAFLTGLLGVGVGECVLPQLAGPCAMPAPLAAGTSVAVVAATAAAAAARRPRPGLSPRGARPPSVRV